MNVIIDYAIIFTMDILWSALLVSFVINMVMFLVAYKLQSDRLTDISYATTFFVLSMYGLSISNKSFFHIVLFLLIALWAIRLGGFLLYRVVRVGKDTRFDKMRSSFVKFGWFWVIQATTVWVLMIASLFAFLSTTEPSLLWIAGLLVAVMGLAIESIADMQKFRFSSNPKNKGKWIDEGLWHYSRHPNYLGEIMMWTGVYLYVATSLTMHEAVLGAVSPLFILLMLLFVSGVPILEKNSDKKWGDLAAYRKYKASTSPLLILPKKSNR